MSNTKFYDCCTEIAHKHNVPTSVVSANRSSYVAKAAELYADRRVEEAMRWIPVSERMPETGVPVLGHLNGGCEVVWMLEGHKWYGPFGYAYDAPSHWMPIPELPKPTQP